jgi:hypothetical protein
MLLHILMYNLAVRFSLAFWLSSHDVLFVLMFVAILSLLMQVAGFKPSALR